MVHFRTIKLLLIWLVIFGNALAVSATSAQPSGNISGKIIDKISGQSVQGTIVTLFDGNDPKYSTQSNINGNFSFFRVPSGSYSMKISKSGYTGTTKSIRVNENFTVKINVTLQEQLAGLVLAKAGNLKKTSGFTERQPKKTKESDEPLKTDHPDQSEQSITVSETTEPAVVSDNFVEFPELPPTPVGGYGQIIKNIPYPAEAIQLGIEGTVVVSVYVDESGHAVGVDILKKVHPLLDESAIKAVYSTKFEPAKQAGIPVFSKVTIPVPFRLN